MNQKMLFAQQNRWYALQGRAMTNFLAEKTQSIHDSIGMITQTYNSLLDKKMESHDGVSSGVDGNLSEYTTYR